MPNLAVNKQMLRNLPRKRRSSESDLDTELSKASFFYLNVFRQAFPAMFLAFVLDHTMRFLQDSFKVHALFMVVFQFFVMVGIMYVIEVFAPRYAHEWQNTTPGLFFVTFYFGCQIHFFVNLNAVAHSLSFV